MRDELLRRKLDVGRLLAALDLRGAVKRGGQWHACCPVHSERKPSWAIRDQPGHEKHGVHGCWSCGFSGDAVALAQRVLGLATRSVARDFVVEAAVSKIKADGIRIVHVDVPLTRSAFKMPAGVTFKPFADWPEVPWKYLADRKLTPEQVWKWSLGYATEGKLAGRIVIPILDDEGRLLSYTARSYTKAPVRYMTPRREDEPDPGALWGERYWLPRGRDLLYVAEGAFKAMAIERAIGDVALAAPGGASSLTVDKIAKLSAWKRIVIVADPDPAGERFAEEFKDAVARTSKVTVIRTEGGDADEIPRETLRAQLELVR